MTNPPFPESPTPDSSNPDSSNPGAQPPAAAPTPPPADAAPTPPPTWEAAQTAAPAAGYPAAGYPAPEAPAYPQPQQTPPGRVLSIVGLVLAFLVAPVGLIISIVAAVKLSKAKQPKGLAIGGIIVGALITIFWIIVVIVLIAVAASLVGMCGELGAGVWEVNGVTYTCG